jgi:hypothetical protein
MWFRATFLAVVGKRPLSKLCPRPGAHFHTNTSRYSQINRLVALSEKLPVSRHDPLRHVSSTIPGMQSPKQCVEGLPWTEPRRYWQDLLESPNIIEKLEHARLQAARGVSGFLDRQDTSAGIRIGDLPPWFPTFVLYHKATTPQEITSSAELMWSYLPTTNPRTSHILTILTVARLSERQLTAALRLFVWRFCQSPHIPTDHHCNLLLRALSLHPRNVETSLLAEKVLELMIQHELRVGVETYDALLHRHFVTLRVATAVKKKMAQEGFKPKEGHLKSLFHLMTAHRFVRKAAHYLDRLQRLQRKRRSEAVALCSDSHMDPSDNAQPASLNTRFVRTFRRPARAIHYLRNLTSADVKISLSRKPHALHCARRRKHNHITLQGWISVLYTASRSKAVTSDRLLKAFRLGANAYPPSHLAYSTVIRGLLYKHDYTNALALWDESCSLNLPLDTISLGNGIRTLAMNGEALRAFQLLEQVQATRQSSATEGKGQDNRKSGHIRPVEVNLQAIHHYMLGMHRMGRPDVVFALWDHMYTLYGLIPDAYTINILLQTARWAKKFKDTIKGQLAYLGFGQALTSAHVIPTEPPSEPRIQASSAVFSLLDPTQRPWVTGMWNSEPPGRAALRVTMQMFIGNWPDLRGVALPVQALRRSGADAATKPLREAINAVMDRVPHEVSPLYELLPEAPTAQYPHIIPTDVTFRAFIDLLAAETLHTEIPLALAWQRALGIAPSKATLATALVYWTEVSMDAPLMERFRGRGAKNPYTQLVLWLEGWVGTDGMPGREEMSAEMRRAAYYRDSRYLQVIQERHAAHGKM